MEIGLDRRHLLANHWILECLSERELDRVLKFSRVRKIPRNKRIFERGDPGHELMAIISGSVKVSNQTEGGKEVLHNILLPGEIFGEIALLDQGPRSADASALEETILLIIDGRYFQPILEDNPELCRRLLELFCQRLRRLTDMELETMFLDGATRLANAILRLLDEHSRKTPDGYEITVPLSQHDLGNLSGLSRESVNKLLGEWRRSGLISIDDQAITIIDRAGLERIGELK